MKKLVLSVAAIAAFAGTVQEASARRQGPRPWECHIEVKNLRGADNAGFVRVTDVKGTGLMTCIKGQDRTQTSVAVHMKGGGFGIQFAGQTNKKGCLVIVAKNIYTQNDPSAQIRHMRLPGIGVQQDSNVFSANAGQIYSRRQQLPGEAYMKGRCGVSRGVGFELFGNYEVSIRPTAPPVASNSAPAPQAPPVVAPAPAPRAPVPPVAGRPSGPSVPPPAAPAPAGPQDPIDNDPPPPPPPQKQASAKPKRQTQPVSYVQESWLESPMMMPGATR